MIFEESPSPLHWDYSWDIVTFVCFVYDSTDCFTQEHKYIMSVVKKSRKDQSSFVYG